MKIHLNIEADTTAEILEAVKELAATGIITTQAKPAETKKQSAKQTKPKEPEAVDVPSESVIDTSTPADDAPPDEETNVEAPSVEDIKKVAVEKARHRKGKRQLRHC